MKIFQHLTLVGVVWLLPSLPADAQDTDKVIRHLPGDTLAVVSMWPRELASKSAMEYAPLEMVTAVALDEIGFDVLLLDRIDVMIGMPGMEGLEFGALLQSSEAFDIANLREDLFDAEGLQNDDGIPYLVIPGQPEMVVYQVDEVTAAVGSRMFAKRMLAKRSGTTDLGKTFQAIKASQDALAVVSIEGLRPLLAGALGNAPPQALPPQIRDDLLAVLESTDMLAIRLQIADAEKIQLVLASKDDAAADSVEQHLASLMQFARTGFVQQFKAQIPADNRTGIAMHQYIERISDKITQVLEPKRVGSRIIIEIDEFRDASVIGTLTGLLLPAVQSARQAAQRMQSSNNLKQLELSLHNFESAYRSFPATAGLDNDGEPILSWRVAILPFLEEQALYERFNLDEPWDSEHNLALLKEMPDVFRNPKKKTQPGYTVYQAAVGAETLLRKTEPTTFRQITDGTSNTIMLLETSPEAAVPWTAPSDFEVDMENFTIENLFFQGTTQVGLGDGSVQVIADSIDIEVLKALFTRAGGEVVALPRN